MTSKDEMDIPGRAQDGVYCCSRTMTAASTTLRRDVHADIPAALPPWTTSTRQAAGTCAFPLDEFANVALPDDFEKLLSTMRSREISVSIIIQNMAQLKALFKDNWESLVGNCDTFLYLGGNEQGTHEYVSKLMGKGTIDTTTHGRNRGQEWQLFRECRPAENC